MGYLGYAFVPLTPNQVEARRLSLDSHARLAQASQVAVVLALSLARLLRLTSSNRRRTKLVWPVAFARRWQWRLQTEVADGCGTWAEWLSGIAWAIWLAFLSAHSTTPG